MIRRMVLAASAALLLPLLASPLLAQRLSLGVLGGANVSTFGGDDAEGAKSRVGFVGGAQLVRTFNDNVALELNGLYSMKGAKGDEDGVGIDAKISYIELPLLLRFGPRTTSTLRPFATVGGSLAFRMGCTVEGRAGGVSVSVDCDDLEEDGADFNDVDAALIGGAGFDAPLGSGTLTVAVRYGYSLTDIAKEDNVQNRAFTILAGWRMPLGK